VAAQVGQPRTLREPIGDQLLGRTGQYGLAAVAQIAQPCGAVDRRAGVVTFIAQLDFARVDPDAKPDRGQRRSLQLQHTGHRVGGAGERGHEAVAFALLDRAHPVVGGDDLVHCLILTSHRSGHLLRLGFPQLRRTLDVGQKQRHGPGRQEPAYAQLAPVQHPRVGLFALVKQRAATMNGETSAKTRRSRPMSQLWRAASWASCTREVKPSFV
jgi:hypothetical protein